MDVYIFSQHKVEDIDKDVEMVFLIILVSPICPTHNILNKLIQMILLMHSSE